MHMLPSATQDSPMLYRHRDSLTGLQRSTACRRRLQCLLSCTAAQTCEASICTSCCGQPCVVCSSVCDRASARQRVTPPHERHACCKFAMLMCDRYLCSASREQSWKEHKQHFSPHQHTLQHRSSWVTGTAVHTHIRQPHHGHKQRHVLSVFFSHEARQDSSTGNLMSLRRGQLFAFTVHLLSVIAACVECVHQRIQSHQQERLASFQTAACPELYTYPSEPKAELRHAR
jgi:hypothetical protein